MEKFLTVKDCLERLPVPVAEKRFRREVRAMALCYKNGHQIALSEEQLQQYIETLKCQTSTSENAKTRRTGKSKAPLKYRAGKTVSASERARALLT